MLTDERNTVLLVDNDQEFLEKIENMLSAGGYEVKAVDKGKAALSLVHSFKPDIILLDLKLDDMDGLQVAYEFKQIPGILDVPIIGMVEDYLSYAHFKLMNFFGIHKCLRKPFFPLEIFSQIEAALEKDQPSRSL